MNRITCREFDELVHGVVRLELLDITLREEALVHAARCANCAERIRAARRLAEANEALADDVREQRAPREVKDALLTAFRATRRRKVWWQIFEWSAAGAAAAMGLLVVWGIYGHPQSPGIPAPKPNVSSQSQQPLEAVAPTLPAAPKATDLSSAPSGDAQVANETVASGDEGDFVPVPYAADLDPQDPGMVIRVQLTPDSLAELGYQVAALSNEDMIRADVLVGEDGWPRAVRVVQ